MKRGLLVSCILLIYVQLFSQTTDNNWIFGVGATAIDFYPTSVGNADGMFSEFANAEDHWTISGPRIHGAVHLSGRFSVDLGISFNSIGKVGDIKLTKSLKYIGLDVSGQYAFLPYDYKLQPYVFVGGGYTVLNDNGAITFNGGLGTTVWINDFVGVNGQAMYKHTSDTNLYVPAHFLYSATLVMRISGLLGDRAHGGKGCYY